MAIHKLPTVVLAVLGLVAGCSGRVDSSGTGPGTPADDSARPRPSANDTARPPNAGPSPPMDPGMPPVGNRELPFKRLTTAHIQNVLRDVFTYTGEPAATLPEITRAGGFTDSGFVRSMLTVAEEVGKHAVAGGHPLSSCAMMTGGTRATCMRAQVGGLGERLWRRPLTEPELQRYGALFESLSASTTPGKAAAAVISALLTSPHFLYRIEGRTLTGHEIAGRLALGIWQSAPDEELLASARAGKLADRAGLEGQARRMLADPRARRLTDSFFGELIPYAQAERAMRSSKTYPGTSAQLFKDFVTETDTFLAKLVWEDRGTFKDLFTASHSYVNARVATFYGATAPGGMAAAQFTRVAMPATRAGILTHGSFLTALAHEEEGSPVLRSVAIRKHLLCETLPAPPADVDLPEPPSPQLSQRQRLAKHASGTCATCHQLIDPLGFGLERYDAVGKYITSEHGHALTGEGRLVGVDERDTSFTGAIELGRLMGESAQARRCMVQQLHDYMAGNESGAAPLPAAQLQALEQRWQTEGLALAALPLAIAVSPSFTKGSL